MQVARPIITKERPVAPDLAVLLARHSVDMRADTPLESIHMMDAGQLDIPTVSFFVMRDAGQPIGMGAFKLLDATHAEIKSMHVLSEYRGQGLSRVMLDYLVQAATASGIARLSLETGSQEMFEPARRLYARASFAECPPFGDYALDPNSVFMTRSLG
jgi:putative acetyltransferase